MTYKGKIMRPKFLDNLYIPLGQRKISRFLKKHRLLIVAGLTAAILLPLIISGMRNSEKRATKKEQKIIKMDSCQKQNDIVSYLSENQR